MAVWAKPVALVACAFAFSVAAYEDIVKVANPCLDERLGNEAVPRWCDMSLSTQERAEAIVGELTLEEKAGLLGNGAKALRRFNISAFQWWNEALHGVANSPGTRFREPLSKATSFPQVLATASSFNRTLFRLIGRAISDEARAFSNLGLAHYTFWTPNINIFRDPRWGRGQETPGEDPLLNGQYAEDFVRSFQEDERDPARLKNSACCKHFAAYNLENWQGQSRMNFNAIVSERDLRETYLPAFEQCVKMGKVSSLMCSYNAINGIPSCANEYLMNDLARESWGFDGYITGDCGAVSNVFSKYHFKHHDRGQVIQDVFNAQVDIACDNLIQNNLVPAVEKGEVQVKQVNRALVNLFKIQIRLGVFDPRSKQPLQKIGAESVDTPEHRRLALEASRQSMILLKNEGKTLPLEANSSTSIALIGPHAEAKAVLQGNYFGVAPFLVSVKDGIRTILGCFKETIKVARGCSIDNKLDADSMLDEAVALAVNSTHTVLVVGISQKQEAEGHDRDHIDLPGRQQELVERVAKASKNPVTLIIIAGGSLDISFAKQNDGVGAIIWAGYAGQSGGQAIAETIFGQNNPSGKLTQTIYPREFVDQVSMIDMNMHPNPETGNPGRTYRFYTGEPVYSFGDGLSFTKFKISRVSCDKIASRTTCNFTITNTGSRPGAHVALAYLEPAEDTVSGKPHQLRRKLVSFHRTPLLQPSSWDSFRVSVTEKDLRVFPSADGMHHTLNKWVLLVGNEKFSFNCSPRLEFGKKLNSFLDSFLGGLEDDDEASDGRRDEAGVRKARQVHGSGRGETGGQEG